MYSKFNVWLSQHAQHRALYSHRPTWGGGYHSARGRVKFLGSFQNIIAALVDYTHTHVQNWRNAEIDQLFYRQSKILKTVQKVFVFADTGKL